MIVDTVWLTLSQYIVTFFRAVAAARRLSSVGSYFCTWAGVNGAIPPPNTIRFGWKDTTGLIPVNDQLIDTPVPVDQSVQAPAGQSVAFSKAACAIEPVTIQSQCHCQPVFVEYAGPIVWRRSQFPSNRIGPSAFLSGICGG
jgi:hypothetical protein